ncbi:hypothetical protein SSX86_015419 [Deinandra increscens subsp. villosa]|uniref:Formin-like protein n=1 Tax=Deinandra increscens subsp. villosa TaxID=3103831 RepID=A0AAP0D538_9ASTR
MHIFSAFLVLTCTASATLVLTCTASATLHNRRTLHQPFFPQDVPTLPPAQPPAYPPTTSPPPSLNIPFLSAPGPTATPSDDDQPFFRSYPSPPPPPPSPAAPSAASFPANISSLSLPTSPEPKRPSNKLVPIAVTLAVAAVIVLFIVVVLKLQKRKRRYDDGSQSFSDEKPQGNDVSLFTAAVINGGNSSYNRIPKLNRPSQTSSEFLYLGTLVNSHGGIDSTGPRGSENRDDGDSTLHKVGSPELRPLPPLSGQLSGGIVGRSQTIQENNETREEDFETFYSPGGGGRAAARRSGSSSSYSSSSSGSPARSISLSISPPVSLSPRTTTRMMKSPDLVAIQTAAPPPSRPAPPPPPPPVPTENRDVDPPTPVVRLNPPVLVKPSRPGTVSTQQPLVFPMPENQENLENNEKIPKAKLKPLHWDKVRASSDRETAWDHLKSNSFKLNEEMIETLFPAKPPNARNSNEKSPIKCPPINHENQVLDPKRSQNISIALRALNATAEDVRDALVEGNVDALGTELLESLSKMAPTKEEERKLRDYRDDSPYKLGPAEKFLKVVLDVPFAFKRINAMLYVSCFDSEIEYLKRSFQTLEAACEELRNNRMFLKLLEAVLKTGNRMNVGTNRGDAQAFKLDTLLKLIDVKGGDGKTTLLHFVVQEITRTEGARVTNPTANQIEKPANGLQLISNLFSDLSNVKKAAAMDSEVLKGDVARLTNGIANAIDVVKLMESTRFSDSMSGFLKIAEEEVKKVQVQESETLSLVKEITEYFHGNSAKEEAHPLRIFMVVRDFLTVLEMVCKEVATVNDRMAVNSVKKQVPVPVIPTTVFDGFHGRRQYSSSDDESSSSL